MNVLAYDRGSLFSLQIHVSGPLSEEDMVAMLAQIREQFRDSRRTAKPWTALIVLESDQGADALQRKRLMELLSEAPTGFMAVVTQSALLRALMTALRWMRTSPITEQTFADCQAARDWLNTSAGVPPSLIDRLIQSARNSALAR